MASLDLPDVDLEAPAGKGLIIVANHRSVVDILVGLAIFRQWRIAPRLFVKAHFFAVPGVGLLLRWMGAIPASPEAARSAIETAVRTLASGGIIALTPEGRVPRAEDRRGGVARLRGGAGRLATELGTPIIVLGIANTDSVWPLGTHFPRIRLNRESRPTIRIKAARLDITQGTPMAQVMAQLRGALSQAIDRAESNQ
jgi:1-acyl-sn-glycerol-3-phosphate acyltransferase